MSVRSGEPEAVKGRVWNETRRMDTAGENGNAVNSGATALAGGLDTLINTPKTPETIEFQQSETQNTKLS
jgi:hypothetical protein